MTEPRTAKDPGTPHAEVSPKIIADNQNSTIRRTFTVTTYASDTGNATGSKRLPWARVVRLLTRRPKGPKRSAGAVILGEMETGTVYPGRKIDRSLANLRGRDAGTVDIDGEHDKDRRLTTPVPADVFARIEAAFPGVALVAVTSSSATAENPRCRLVIAFGRTVDEAEYRRLMAEIVRRLDEAGIPASVVDPVSTRPVQLMYLVTDTGSTYARQLVQEGEPLDVDQALAVAPALAEVRAADAAGGLALMDRMDAQVDATPCGCVTERLDRYLDQEQGAGHPAHFNLCGDLWEMLWRGHTVGDALTEDNEAQQAYRAHRAQKGGSDNTARNIRDTAARTAGRQLGTMRERHDAEECLGLIGSVDWDDFDEALADDQIEAAIAEWREEADLLGDEVDDAAEAAKRAELEEVQRHELAVRRELEKMLVREEARRRFDEAQGTSSPAEDVASRLMAGGAAVLDLPVDTEPLWGRGEQQLWADGEALMIAGGQGAGKTTLGQQLALGAIGVPGFGELLGLPVTPVAGKVLYLAMDRPKQALRSLARMVRDEDRAFLDERLVVWPGPPPKDIAAHPETLVELAQAAGAGVVFVDSIKDAALGLSEDEVGAGYNRARQAALASGIQVVELHHQRKASQDRKGATPGIDEVYGSTWLTSGAGSVVFLEGKPGDPLVRLHHLKQPQAEVGPLTILHDGPSGRTVVSDRVDLVTVAQCRSEGLTAQAAASVMFETEKPTANQKAKARRELARLEKAGLLVVVQEGDAASKSPTVWGPVSPAGQVEAGVLDDFETFDDEP